MAEQQALDPDLMATAEEAVRKALANLRLAYEFWMTALLATEVEKAFAKVQMDKIDWALKAPNMKVVVDGTDD